MMTGPETKPETKPNCRILVKVSGDLVHNEDFFEWLKSFSTADSDITVLCGGGTAITEELEANDVPFEFGPAGRKILTERGINLAYEVLQRQREQFENELKNKRIEAKVAMPVIYIGDMICHVNGDWYIRAVYPNFDKIYVATLTGRSKSFDGFERIEVVSFN